MSAISGYTLPEAQEMLTAWKACEQALASGQAESYRVGSREYKAIDLDKIAARITYFSNLVEALSGNVRTRHVVRIVPRDL